MPIINCSEAAALASAFQPILRSSTWEPFFPIDPLLWVLDSDPESDWSTPGGRTGTTLLHVPTLAPGYTFQPTDIPASNTIAFPTLAPSAQPPKLRNDSSAAGGIGAPTLSEFKLTPRDYYLNFRGWKDDQFAAGNLDKIWDRVRSLRSSIGIDPPSQLPPAQVIKNATIYAEVEWAGMFPRLDHSRVERIRVAMAQKDVNDPRDLDEMAASDRYDFPPQAPGGDAMTSLDCYLVITYYLFYPAALALISERGPDPTDPPIHLFGPREYEGQWEAVSLFLKADVERTPSGSGFLNPDLDGRPGFRINFADLNASFDFDASYAVITRGWGKVIRLERGARTACVRNLRKPYGKSAVRHDGLHPIIDVAWYNHANLYKPAFSFVAVTGEFPWGEVAGILGAMLGVLAAIGGEVAALFLAILAFLLALLLLFIKEAVDPPVGIVPSAAKVDGENYYTPLDPQASFALAPKTVALPGRTAVPELMTVNRYNYIGSECPPPPFWSFAGHWGAPMAIRDQWDGGDRRVDPYGRSLAYWNAVKLATTVLGCDPNSTTGCLSCDDFDGLGTVDFFPAGLCRG